jgi:hypothetical protein
LFVWLIAVITNNGQMDVKTGASTDDLRQGLNGGMGSLDLDHPPRKQQPKFSIHDKLAPVGSGHRSNKGRCNSMVNDGSVLKTESCPGVKITHKAAWKNG